jgi:hypothetical protein
LSSIWLLITYSKANQQNQIPISGFKLKNPLLIPISGFKLKNPLLIPISGFKLKKSLFIPISGFRNAWFMQIHL